MNTSSDLSFQDLSPWGPGLGEGISKGKLRNGFRAEQIVLVMSLEKSDQNTARGQAIGYPSSQSLSLLQSPGGAVPQSSVHRGQSQINPSWSVRYSKQPGLETKLQTQVITAAILSTGCTLVILGARVGWWGAGRGVRKNSNTLVSPNC